MRQIIKSMRSRYVLAVLAMAILVTLVVTVIVFFLKQKQQEVEVINRAGMQRMLSQEVHWVLIRSCCFTKKENKRNHC